jgi:hypothetical protein
MPLSSATDATLPWLIVRSPANLHWTTSRGGHSLEAMLLPLAEDECLIGFAGADPDALKAYFQNKKLVGVPLDLGNPLQGPVAAWAALDGIVLDATAAARVTKAQLAGLLAQGTAVAIRSRQRPAGRWPWRRAGEYWVLQVPISGPTSAYVPAAYDPTAGWTRGWPAAFRRQIVLAAVLFSILALATTLWRSRWAVVLLVSLCGIAAGGAIAWRANQSVTLQAGGSILVLTQTTSQQDIWEYRSVMRSADPSVDWRDAMWPVFGSRMQVEQKPVRLVCSVDGQPIGFRFHLEPGRSLAFLTRMLRPEPPVVATTTPVSSPLRVLAENAYLREGDQIVGQVAPADSHDQRWSTVVIEQSRSEADLRSRR